jgi:hypothetical protein
MDAILFSKDSHNSLVNMADDIDMVMVETGMIDQLELDLSEPSKLRLIRQGYEDARAHLRLCGFLPNSSIEHLPTDPLEPADDFPPWLNDLLSEHVAEQNATESGFAAGEWAGRVVYGVGDGVGAASSDLIQRLEALRGSVDSYSRDIEECLQAESASPNQDPGVACSLGVLLGNRAGGKVINENADLVLHHLVLAVHHMLKDPLYAWLLVAAGASLWYGFLVRYAVHGIRAKHWTPTIEEAEKEANKAPSKLKTGWCRRGTPANKSVTRAAARTPKSSAKKWKGIRTSPRKKVPATSPGTPVTSARGGFTHRTRSTVRRRATISPFELDD